MLPNACLFHLLQVSRIDTPLISQQVPHRVLPEEQLTVALVGVLKPGVHQRLALLSAQTLVQHLQTAQPGIYGAFQLHLLCWLRCFVAVPRGGRDGGAPLKLHS